jgi:flavin reductase (DIM6/NTAB) family NADH-FMN oxidoreductase RutF
VDFFSSESLDSLNKIYRINLINSITGYKSANLLGTISKKGVENVAIFSSVTHLGSNPALLSFFVRPNVVPRNTYKNIKEKKIFTVNHISKDKIGDAHHTSAKYDEDISEFDKTSFQSEYKNNWKAPFVKDSAVQLGCKYLNEYYLKENGCSMIVASIEIIFIKEGLLQNDGWVELSKGDVVTVNGLDAYALPKTINRFKYARPK